MNKFTNYAFLAAFSLFAMVANAQQIVFQEKVDTRGLANISGLAADDHIVFAAQPQIDKVNIHIKGPDGPMVVMPLSRKYLYLTGYVETATHLHVYIRTRGNDEGAELKLESVTYDKANKRITAVKPIVVHREEDELAIIADNKGFMRLTRNWKEQKLFANEYEGEQIKERHEIPVTASGVWGSMIDYQYHFIDTNVPNTFNTATTREKIFRVGNKLHILDDRWIHQENAFDIDAVVVAIEIDLDKKTLTKKSLKLNERNVLHNSFLFDNRLFVLSAGKFVDLAVYDYETGQELVRHKTDVQPIPFQASIMLRNGKPVNGNTINKMNNGLPVISVMKGENQTLRMILGGLRTDARVVTQLSSTDRATAWSNWSMLGTMDSRDVTWGFYGYLNADDLSIPTTKPVKHGVFTQVDERITTLNNTLKIAESIVFTSPKGVYLVYLERSKQLTVEMFAF